MSLCSPPRVPCASNCHQLVPTEAPGKWLVQPSSCEAETDNNWGCPALPQQATGAWVLHLALPRGGGRKASPLTPLSCPNTGSQAHTHTTHSYSPPVYHLQLCLHTHTHTYTHRIFIFILYYFVIYMNTLYQHCLPLTLRSKCQKPCQGGGKKTAFLCCSCSLEIWMAEVQQWLSLLV